MRVVLYDGGGERRLRAGATAERAALPAAIMYLKIILDVVMIIPSTIELPEAVSKAPNARRTEHASGDVLEVLQSEHAQGQRRRWTFEAASPVDKISQRV